MVVGGIAIKCGFVDEVRRSFQALTKEKEIKSEVKWEKCTRHRLDAYKALADLAFDLIDDNRLHFHCLITNFERFDHKRGTPKKDKAESVGRMLYQLSLHRTCKPYGSICKIHIRPDRGECSRHMPRMRQFLNRDAKRQWKHDQPISSIDTIDSASEPLLQLNDIILGAVASHRNNRHLSPYAAKQKTELAEYVRKRSGLANYSTDTLRSATRFTVWNFKVEGGPRS